MTTAVVQYSTVLSHSSSEAEKKTFDITPYTFPFKCTDAADVTGADSHGLQGTAEKRLKILHKKT